MWQAKVDRKANILKQLLKKEGLVMKKLIATLLTIVMFACCLSMSANASVHIRTVDQGSSRFTEEWEHTRVYVDIISEDYIGSLVYGYDTDWFNQDYAWSEGDKCKTRAGIKRVGKDEDIIYGDWALKDTYGTYVVSHESNVMIYAIEFEYDYENVITGYTNHNTNVNR